MSSQHALISLVARVLLSAIFITAGYQKIGGYDGTLQYMASQGVPGFMLPAVIALELGGGLAILFGLFSRWAALGLAIFSVVAALIFHTNFADQMQAVAFMKNLAIAGGLLLLFANGPGAWAVRD
ncbi:MAG: DoxX family protein [Hyphomicrobiaceae bacterium]|jgi:putative oxidoreductase|nr:DoxX family protein [Hyphomicrobiaceae bacterium]